MNSHALNVTVIWYRGCRHSGLMIQTLNESKMKSMNDGAAHVRLARSWKVIEITVTPAARDSGIMHGTTSNARRP
ncbi:hypothetical protein E2C01_006900 [Portunus trituberculatus]|uniref:Uncharacterized protein n=1 Tax=Portunus trituberculatus TaxID=210409 RepID=A0A5B7CZD6_PORTR|nr:hypothetical protein [Portunus trituberculatus]